MQKWEYMAINIEASGIYNKKLNEKTTIGELNKLGQEGWEVVSSAPISRRGGLTGQEATYAFAFVFKRPVA
jgi:hypothetical protein